MTFVDVSDMSGEEIQTCAAEAQKVVGAIAAKGRVQGKAGSSGSNDTKQRQFIKCGKTNRGFKQGNTCIDFDGQISFGATDLQDRMGACRKVSKCGACGEPGRWAGDPECPKVKSGEKPLFKPSPSAPKKGPPKPRMAAVVDTVQSAAATQVDEAHSSDDEQTRLFPTEESIGEHQIVEFQPQYQPPLDDTLSARTRWLLRSSDDGEN